MPALAQLCVGESGGGASGLQPSSCQALFSDTNPCQGPPLCQLAVGTFPRASGPHSWPSYHFWGHT